jgi:hypothetical protein
MHEEERKRAAVLLSFTCLLIYYNFYRSVLRNCCGSGQSVPSVRRRLDWRFSIERPSPAITGLQQTSTAVVCGTFFWRSAASLW